MKDYELNEKEDIPAECEFSQGVLGKCARSGTQSPATSCYPYVIN